jgi:transcriptional regulator with XRE-family HTH domain
MAVLAVFYPQFLRHLRVCAELSRPELARRVGLSPLTISDYERGRRTPSAAALGRLATALGVPVGDLYTGPEPPRATP